MQSIVFPGFYFKLPGDFLQLHQHFAKTFCCNFSKSALFGVLMTNGQFPERFLAHS